MPSSSPQVHCEGCNAPRWAGYGPCSQCGAPSPEYLAETARINAARAEAGLPPLADEAQNGGTDA